MNTSKQCAYCDHPIAAHDRDGQCLDPTPCMCSLGSLQKPVEPVTTGCVLVLAAAAVAVLVAIWAHDVRWLWSGLVIAAAGLLIAATRKGGQR